MSRNRLGTKSVAALRALLTARDQAILRTVFDHKFLTSRQLCALHFTDHASDGSATRACNRVLNRLQHHKLLYRLERPVGGHGGGSSSFVWALDAAGDRFMRAEAGKQSRGRTYEPTTMFLIHTLAIVDVRIMLQRLAREGQIEVLKVVTEPHNWRTSLSRTGTAQIVKPDLHALTASGDYEDAWFIEVDRGTESMPTLLKKCLIYQRHYESGYEQDAHGLFPLVVWLIGSERRRQRLAKDITADKRLNAELFRIIAAEELPALIADPTSTAAPGAKPEPKGGIT